MIEDAAPIEIEGLRLQWISITTIKQCTLTILQVANQYVRQFNTSTWLYCTLVSPTRPDQKCPQASCLPPPNVWVCDTGCNFHGGKNYIYKKTQAKHRLYVSVVGVSSKELFHESCSKLSSQTVTSLLCPPCKVLYTTSRMLKWREVCPDLPLISLARDHQIFRMAYS